MIDIDKIFDNFEWEEDDDIINIGDTIIVDTEGLHKKHIWWSLIIKSNTEYIVNDIKKNLLLSNQEYVDCAHFRIGSRHYYVPLEFCKKVI